MRTIAAIGLLAAGCGQAPRVDQTSEQTPAAEAAAEGWRLHTGEDPVLVLASRNGAVELQLICSADRRQLLVNVPAFEPVGSEERLSFGQGGEVVALVADVRGDSARGGVTGSSAPPDNLAQLLAGPVAASYGSQTSGPHLAPPAALADAFAAACSGEAPAEGDEGPGEAAAAASPCLMARDGKAVPSNAIKAIGTEPFWAALVEGRCVTYSHPENQSGTRVWTSFSGTAADGTWTGSLGGQPFVMRTRPQPGCSDGMSDKRYPIAVSLTVGGEQRSGCAEPR